MPCPRCGAPQRDDAQRCASCGAALRASLDEAIASVAIEIRERPRFEARARALAGQLGPSAIDALTERFHAPLRPEPPGFGAKELGLGGWLSIWQAAIFELLYQLGAPALPVLRRVAFGRYDWTQASALEVLVRLAAAGIESDAIVDELRRALPGLRFEAILYCVRTSLAYAAHDPAVAAVVRGLEDLPEWRDAATELRR